MAQTLDFVYCKPSAFIHFTIPASPTGFEHSIFRSQVQRNNCHTFICVVGFRATIKEHESHAKYGAEFKLHCTLKTHFCVLGRVTSIWYKVDSYYDAHPIEEEDQNYVIQPSFEHNKDGTVTVSELTILRLDERMEGTYQCYVTNLCRTCHAETPLAIAGGRDHIQMPNA